MTRSDGGATVRPRIERSALILLAAGRSSRFGAGCNKLEQDLHGLPLGLHAARVLASLPFAVRVAVVAGHDLDLSAYGFQVIRNHDPAAGMARSIRLGVETAERQGVEAVVVALADMPCVTAAHVERLFEAADRAGVVASSDGDSASPPALFGRAHFASLRGLSGDIGARDLIRAARHVMARPAELVDVDTALTLDALRTARES
ncbi:molybdenum cofactor cytidylyltransferase [Sphingomonas gellani]|uniref:Molybdenum cofactor cytidylyltransferase n=1 Tax=Sphingomonas gellani TaxID=1166340 RepID=A0A1H8BB18_9SPHN|nr:nucleotidyltransferase family protein [Sphingomonas gellani]SEM80002.1 molybdenum cofactor cytidylyltransferase [Sphingomonas gellani]